MNNTAIKSILSVAALTLTAGLSSQAVAGAMDETFVQGAAAPSRTVTYDRGELATAQGRARVERRIEKAAEAVCGSITYRQAGGLSRLVKNRACYDQAVENALSELGSDLIVSID